MFENKYPYTDFHELNLDWFLAEFKNVYNHVDDLDATVQQFTEFVTNYFNNLDVQEEINNKLNAMAEDGSLSALIQPLFDEYKTEINGIVANQNAAIQAQNDDIDVLEGRMDAFASLTVGSTTGDAELMDIRVQANGVTAASAGNAVRNQIDNTISLLSSINQWDELWVNGILTASGTLDNTGNRIVSQNYIPVVSGKTYYTNTILNAKFYDEDKNHLSALAQTILVGEFTVDASAKFMKFYTQSDYDSNDPQVYNNDISINMPANIIDYVPYGLKESERYMKNQIGVQYGIETSLNVWDEQWLTGSLTANGSYSSTGTRVVSQNYIPVTAGNQLYFNKTLVCRWFNEHKQCDQTLNGDYSGVVTVPVGMHYLKFYTLSTYAAPPQTYQNDIIISKNVDVTDYVPYGKDEYFKYIIDKIQAINLSGVIEGSGQLTAGAWNVHKFSPDSTPKCPDATVGIYLPRWKAQISTTLGTDVLMINEWQDYFDRSNTYDTYDTLFKQFYPYKYIVSNNKALLSRIPLQFTTATISSLTIIIGTNTDYSLAVVCWVQSNIASVATREAAYTTIISTLSAYNNVIIGGDFNNDAGAAELSKFTDAGYTLGNSGYWGDIYTCTSSTNPNYAAIDNIVVKGFVMQLFEAGSDRLVSDHFPVKAILKY